MKSQWNQDGWIAKHKARIYLATVALSFFLVTLARSWISILHLPPDPGLEFQMLAKADGLSETFTSYNGYPQVIPRLMSEFLNLVPLSQLTFWSTILNAIITTVCACAVAEALRELVGTRTAICIGMVLAASFPAHEGLIGNLWAIRWILLPAACVIAAVPTFAQNHWRFTFFIFFVTGLSHAYIFIPAGIYLLHSYIRRDYRARTYSICSLLIILTGYQGLGYLKSSRQLQLYGENTVYWPWVGAGVFWWAVFAIPLVFAFAAALPILRLQIPRLKNFTPRFAITIQAILISTLSYLQLGVKSSPAVATVTISFAALMMAVNGTTIPNTQSKVGVMVKVLSSLLIFVLSVRFYFPSSFLTYGDGWPKTVETALVECADFDIELTELVIFQVNDLVQSEFVSCDYLNKWDNWFFTR